MSTVSVAEVSARRDSVLRVLTSPDLAAVVDLVVWADPDADSSAGEAGRSDRGLTNTALLAMTRARSRG